MAISPEFKTENTMKVSMIIAALMLSATAFATKPAATPAAAPAAAAHSTATASNHKMTEAEAKKACMTEKAEDMTKCVAGKMTPAMAH
jgi:hypothetical protein